MAKILLLEDDKDIREVVEWILEAEGYEVVSFPSVNDFTNRNANNLPDLFILDIMLPDGSGLDVCKQLRLESAFQRTPIIIMSAHGNKEQVDMGCKADDFIQKPFELNIFLDTIHIHLNASTS